MNMAESAVCKAHEREYGEAPEAVVSVPGVITLMGEYADLCDGFALSGAVGLTVDVAISKRKDNSLRFYSLDLEERKRTTIPNLKFRREDRWANFLKGVLYEIFRRNYEFKGLNITIQGAMLQKMGLKSSTALCTATALALKTLFEFDIDDNQLIQAVYFAETSFLQIKSRLIDIMTMLYAKPDHLLIFDLHSLDHRYVPFNMQDVEFLVTDSDIPPFSIREEILYREEACQKGFQAIRTYQPGGLLREITLGDIKGVSETLPEDQKRFCSYVLEESRRVLEVTHALEQHDAVAIGKIMNRVQAGLRDQFEVSCPEIDWLTKRAMEVPGCYGSNLIGPGFGGCTLTLLDKGKVDTYTERLEEYEHIFGFRPNWFLYKAEGRAKLLKVL